MTNQTDALFELGRQSLRALTDELAARQVNLDAGLDLRRGDGLLCHYSVRDGHIYLSVPDAEQASGRFVLFFFRCMLNVDSAGEVMRLLELLIPWLVAHEVAHALRHQYGLLAPSRWDEELIANRLAGAFVNRRLTMEQTQELRHTLARAIGQMPDDVCRQREPDEPRTAGNTICYVYLHMCWLHAYLAAQKECSVDEFVHCYLRRSGGEEDIPQT